MANYQLSRDQVRALLKDNIQISPNCDEKVDYFRNGIKNAFPDYRKQFNAKKEDFDLFAERVIMRHNHKIKSSSPQFLKNYFKSNEHINELIKGVIKSEEAKNDPTHIFTRDQIIDPIIMEFENLINRRYHRFNEVNTDGFDLAKTILYRMTERFFNELISGLILLEREFYNDAFIIWRSLLETTTNLLILEKNPSLSGKYDERRKIALTRTRLLNASTKDKISKSKETLKHAGRQNLPWHVAERFGWAGELIGPGGEYSLKTLLDKVNLGELYPHYTFASLFVHEYLISAEDLQIGIDFNYYLLTLYFKIYELVRVIISSHFTNDLNDAKKLEGNIRAFVSRFSGRFNDFSRDIQNA